MNIYLILASVFSFLGWGVHTFIGTPEVARPLLESTMQPVPKYTNYYCWHLITMVLFAMGAGFAYAAFYPGGKDVAILMTALSAGFAIWSLALIRLRKRKLMELPQWTFFVVITPLGIIGTLV